MKFTEELDTVGTPAPQEDIENAKKEVIKASLGEEDLNLENLTDEELDQLLGKTASMHEAAENIIKEMELLGADDFNIQEALRVNLGFKMEEANNILKDFRLND